MRQVRRWAWWFSNFLWPQIMKDQSNEIEMIWWCVSTLLILIAFLHTDKIIVLVYFKSHLFNLSRRARGVYVCTNSRYSSPPVASVTIHRMEEDAVKAQNGAAENWFLPQRWLTSEMKVKILSPVKPSWKQKLVNFSLWLATSPRRSIFICDIFHRREFRPQVSTE